MKHKFVKLAVLALTLVATCAAMVVPSMAAEPSSFVFVQFENPDHAEYVSYKQSDAFTYDAATGRVSSTGLGTSDFFLSLQNSVSPKSGCYYFSLGLWCASPDEALSFRFTYRYDGWECTLFTSSDGILKQSGKAVCDFTEGTVFYLSCFIDANGQKAYYSVVDENGDGLTPFTMIDLAAIGRVSVFSSDRLLYIYSSAKTSTEYCVFSDITVYEVPSSTLKAFGETALGGYDDGYAKGYDEGFINGEEYGWVNGLDEGYASGKADGLTEGQEQGYNDGFTAGKDEGIEEGYFHGTIDGYDNGYADGLAAGKEEGKEEGYQDGHADGYGEGYNSGYDDGHYEGAFEGYGNGRTDGLAEGYQNGYADGEADGLEAGHAAGYDQGSSDGYILGYGEGEIVGYNKGIEDSNFVFDAVNGVWHGVIEAYETLADGISIFNVSLGSVVTTAGVLLLVTFVVKVVRGS